MTAVHPVIGVLDDEPDMRKALSRLLTGRGYDVREYAGGEDLLLDAERQLLDCLLLDLHMPHYNGLKVLGALHFRRIKLPVIVITAHDSPETEFQVKSLGAVAYLKKPIGSSLLFPAIKAAISTVPPPSGSASHPENEEPPAAPNI
jgi:FixJ family two-component response regulator